MALIGVKSFDRLGAAIEMWRMTSALPQFYLRWLGDLLPAPIEADPVDCLNCHMLHPKGLTRDLGPFKANLKCCTFQPFLPSFTIGALLEMASRAGPASLAQSLEVFLLKSRLTKQGAIPKKGATSICETGKHEIDVCPFLSKSDNAICTIRDFRPSTCAGYVCHSSRGQVGLKNWERWELEVSKFESTVSHLSAFELGWTLEDIDVEFPSVELAKSYYLQSYEQSLRLQTVDII